MGQQEIRCDDVENGGGGRGQGEKSCKKQRTTIAFAKHDGRGLRPGRLAGTQTRKYLNWIFSDIR